MLTALALHPRTLPLQSRGHLHRLRLHGAGRYLRESKALCSGDNVVWAELDRTVAAGAGSGRTGAGNVDNAGGSKETVTRSELHCHKFGQCGRIFIHIFRELINGSACTVVKPIVSKCTRS